MRFSQIGNSRIPKSCVIIGLDRVISVLENSKIPYRDPQLKLGMTQNTQGGDFYKDCFASLAMTEF